MARNCMRRDVSKMLTAVCILMRQMRQMVPVPVVSQTAAVGVERMDATTAIRVVSIRMAAVTTVPSMTAAMPTVASPTVASTSHGQGNCRQN